MPWRVGDVDKYMSGLTRQQKRQWVNVANSALKACQKAGNEDCDAQAIIRANGVLSRQKEKLMKAKTAAEAKMQPVGEIVSPASALPETTENDEMAESYGDSYPSYYVPMDVLTFAQLDNTEEASDIQRKVQELTDKFFTLTRNIIYSPESVDRLGGMKNLTAEYIERLAVILESEGSKPEGGNDDMPEPDEMPAEPGEAAAGLSEAERLSEADTSQIMALSETPAPGEVLKLDVAIIRPGWGNKVDKHYYSKEMLAQYADRFVGAKMYETDHRPEEKSTRTWVSTVTEIVGFTDDGAPIGRVAVHDPSFAARMRNLDEAKLLDKMACSILATGRAQAYEDNGIKGKKVTEIVEVESVDWVTRAGAGGQALNLAESEGGLTMEVVEQTEQMAQETEQPQEPETETETAAEAQPEPETPVNLEEAEIVKIITASTLPDASKRRLAKLAYATEQDLQEAVTAEIEYLKEATGSGQVIGLGETQKPPKQYNPEAVNEAADRVNKKYFGG